RLEDRLELLGDGVEVRDQQLDAGVRVECLDLAHCLGVEPCAAVGPLVAVQLGGLAGVDLAEVAPPGALLATDEEGGLAVLPALVDVGAAGRLADRVQPFAADQRLQLGVLRAGLEPGLDPLRLALDRHLAVADLETQELAAARPDRRTRISGRYGRLRHDPHGTPDATRPRAARRRPGAESAELVTPG